MQKAAKEAAKSRMWGGLFCAALLTLHASFAIWNHELMGKGRSTKISPVMGVVVGSIEIVFVLYLLVVYAWGGYRDLRAEGKEKSATQI
jgi:hypothetical protein